MPGSCMIIWVLVSVIGTRTMKRTVRKATKEFSAPVGRALRRAAKVARKPARMHVTPIYISKDGKVVASVEETFDNTWLRAVYPCKFFPVFSPLHRVIFRHFTLS